MNALASLLVCGAFPDRLNHNAGLRDAIVGGLRECLPPDAVRECRFENAAATVAALRPDAVLLVGSCYPDALRYGPLREACDRAGARLVFWLHDDPYELDTNYRATEVADVIFTSDRWAARHYAHPHAYHLPMAADPVTHRRPADARRYVDFFFCGVAFPNRVNLLRDLAPHLAEFNASVFGDGWPADLPFCRNQRLKVGQVADLCAVSLLTLNVGRHLDLANRRFQLPASTPGPRTFEAAMAGAVQLVFVESLEIVDYFTPGEEVLLFDTPAEAAELLRGLRREPARAARIGAAAQRRALAEHTYAHRARQLLDRVNALR